MKCKVYQTTKSLYVLLWLTFNQETENKENMIKVTHYLPLKNKQKLMANTKGRN